MPTECRYCAGLECQADYHDAAHNIHAYLRSLVNRNWAKDMAKAKAEAKKLWKDRRAEKPDYRTEFQRVRARKARASRA